MRYLDLLEDVGLSVNWRTLLVGHYPVGQVFALVSIADVQDFAERQIHLHADLSAEVIAIASAEAGDIESIRQNLGILAGRDPHTPEHELRKWRVVLLLLAMKDLPENPMSGLLALTDFWSQFSYSDDSPHVVQGRGNDISPQRYYAEANFRDAVERHRLWIAAELRNLCEQDRDRLR